MESDIVAVITADMVNSTLFSRKEINLWLEELIHILQEHREFDWILKPEIYRGDSFQCVLKNPDQALKLAVLARAVMRSKAEETDLRIAVGIGLSGQLSDRPGTSDGEAFRLSGHLADGIRKQKARIAIGFHEPSEPLTATMDLLETVIGNWTGPQSAVIADLLQNESITSISERISISQSAVSQRLSSAKWWAVSNFLATFPKHLTLYTKPKS